MQNKYTSLLVLVLLLLLLAASGCARQAASEVGPDGLLGRSFILQSVDGKAYRLKESAPGITFGENMRVSGTICNQFSGQGRLEAGKLTVSRLASTRKLCFEQDLNRYEQLISAMLMEGVELEYASGLLTMRQGGHSLVYKRIEPRP